MTKKEIFRDIAGKISGKDCSNLPGLCPDQYVGIVEKLKPEENFHRENIFKGETADIKKDFSACEHVIILILESPHTDEFDENGNPIGPANGKAGSNIRKHIIDIFGEGYKSYHLILMNPIPFQCSLGLDLNNNEPNKKTRDAVFKAAWEDGNIGAIFFKTRFHELLAKLKNKRVIVVNACTAEGSKKEKVQMVIDAEFGIIQLAHPSLSWRTQTKAQREKVEAAGLYEEKNT